MILLLDNYDSFTFNLYQYLGELGEEIVVKRNDKITLNEIEALQPSAIILSPGPGRPEHAGICIDVIKKFHQSIPILGICLGHQAIGYAFGAEIVKAQTIMHGKVSRITHTDTTLFHNIPEQLDVMRYHSLVIKKGTLPQSISVTALSTDDQEIMAIKHNIFPLYGMQFHPESIGTEAGKQLLQNFLLIVKEENPDENISTKTF